MQNCRIFRLHSRRHDLLTTLHLVGLAIVQN
jgi:hypothetical protein